MDEIVKEFRLGRQTYSWYPDNKGHRILLQTILPT